MKKLTLSLLLLFLLVSSAVAQVSVGEAAPGFSLPYLGGSMDDQISLESQEGKVVYIFFYGAGCPHCRSNGPVTETEIYQTFKDDTNFVALGIDTWNQNASSNNSFKNVTGITYPLLLNGQSVLVDYYGGSGFYDRSLVIGADGLVSYKGSGWVNSDYQDVVANISTELEKISTSSESIGSEEPTEFRLNQNYPNPFNPTTTISYQLESISQVKLEIFNSLGQQVATLVDGVQSPGNQSVTWNAIGVPSGIYIYRLSTDNQVLTKSMLLLK